MTGNDIAAPRFRPKLSDLALALGLLTRIPLPPFVFPDVTQRPAATAAWAYPLVGVVVGSAVVMTLELSLRVGLPGPFCALLGLVVGVMLTGGMHEDGLADCADGFWGGWSTERRLEIMKDSLIGSYGVIALVCSLLARWMALAALLEVPGWPFVVLAAAVVSRASMVAVMFGLPNARRAGLSHQTGRPPLGAAGLAVLIGVAVAFFIASNPALVLGAAIASSVTVAIVAQRKIGGQTGDVLGATQQICEIALLWALVAVSTP